MPTFLVHQYFFKSDLSSTLGLGNVFNLEAHSILYELSTEERGNCLTIGLSDLVINNVPNSVCLFNENNNSTDLEEYNTYMPMACSPTFTNEGNQIGVLWEYFGNNQWNKNEGNQIGVLWEYFGNNQWNNNPVTIQPGATHTQTVETGEVWQIWNQDDDTMLAEFTMDCDGNLDFQGLQHETFSELYWMHSKDELIEEFILERSTNGIDFQELAIYESEAASYVDIYKGYDMEPEKGLNYYRLKLIYADGSTYYSAHVLFEFKDLIDFVLFPNPANNIVKINLEAIMGQSADIQIINNLGVEVKNLHVGEVWYPYQEVNLESLPEGYYTVWIKSPEIKPVAKTLFIGKI